MSGLSQFSGRLEASYAKWAREMRETHERQIAELRDSLDAMAMKLGKALEENEQLRQELRACATMLRDFASSEPIHS